jgi:GDP-L-fucose synthase
MSNFWTGKSILVTGGEGFVGSHLVRQLDILGANIFAPSHRTFDLRKERDILRVLGNGPFDIAIHLAASVGGIGANMLNPGKFFYDNIMMGVQLMDLSFISGVKKFVNIGTVCAYPKFSPIPFKEENLWDGYPEDTNAPYGIAKKSLFVMSKAYRDQYHFNSINLIPVNLYGPGDNFDLNSSHVIPAIIHKVCEEKKWGRGQITLWGDGTATREFLYVEDAVEGILLATEHYNSSDPVNLGTGKEISIKDLAYKIKDIIKCDSDIAWHEQLPNGQPRRCLDVSKAKELFGFTAKTDLDEGLEKTIDWYFSNNIQG